MTELEEKLEWVKSCKCERPLCVKEIAEGTHDQSKTGCPSCDFCHAEYPLFMNKEVLALIDKRKPDITKVDRFEVIDETGRAYVKGSIYGSPVKIELSYQDDGRTLKVFVSAKHSSKDRDERPL